MITTFAPQYFCYRSDFGSVSDLAGPAADFAGSADASVVESSLGSFGDTWSSIVDSVVSAKEQVKIIGLCGE